MSQSQSNMTQQWVSFVLGDEIYAINVLRVQEVLRPTEITPVAGAPNFVLGIINLRGNVVTVIDARQRLRLPPVDPTNDTRVIMVEVGDQVVGVMVDRVGDVLNVKQSEIEPTPNVVNEELSGNVQGVTTRGNQLVIIVDLDKLLANDQLQSAVSF
jgi:purine-binding chemotaxis protein CheW